MYLPHYLGFFARTGSHRLNYVIFDLHRAIASAKHFAADSESGMSSSEGDLVSATREGEDLNVGELPARKDASAKPP